MKVKTHLKILEYFLRSVKKSSLKGSSDAHFPRWYDFQFYMILKGLKKVYKIRWLKFLNGSVNIYIFQNQLCFHQAIIVRVDLNANEICWPRPSLPWGDEQYYLL